MILARYACHGLGVIQPIDLVAMDLSRETRERPPFHIVGGADPRVEQPAIEARMELDHKAGKSFVWIGHSMGAALGYYLVQKFRDWHFSLVITVDPMNWASNINCEPWQASPPRPGWWRAEGNFDRWINIRSKMPPGAGILYNAKSPRCEDHLFASATHIGIIELPEVRAIIDPAVRAVR